MLVIVVAVVLGLTGIAVAATGGQATLDDIDNHGTGTSAVDDVSTVPGTASGTDDAAAAAVYGDDLSSDTRDDLSAADDESADDDASDGSSDDQESSDVQPGDSPPASQAPSSSPGGSTGESGSGYPAGSSSDSASSGEAGGSADDRS